MPSGSKGFGVPAYNQAGQYVGHECPTCFTMGEYSAQWDSMACMTCRIWLDDACRCTGEVCPFANRPETPEFFEGPFGPTLQ